MHKHWMSVHKEDKEKPKFKAKVVRFHQRPMVRQLEEAVILWRLSRGPGPGDPPGPGIRILNSKSMYNRCIIDAASRDLYWKIRKVMRRLSQNIQEKRMSRMMIKV